MQKKNEMIKITYLKKAFYCQHQHYHYTYTRGTKKNLLMKNLNKA
jgi:hypothetical protein